MYNTYKLFYEFELSKNSNIDPFKLVGDWENSINPESGFGIETGILGFGWVVCFLFQKRRIVGRPEKVLEEIDDLVYKFCHKKMGEDNIDIASLLDLLTYFQQRHILPTSYYRLTSYKACISAIIAKFNSYVLGGLGNDFNSRTITKSVDILLKYSFLINKVLQEKAVEKVFCEAVERLLLFFAQHNNPDIDSIYKLGITIKQYRNMYWEQRISSIIKDKHLQNQLECNSPWRYVSDIMYSHHMGCIEIDRENLTKTDLYKHTFLIFTNVNNIIWQNFN